jgi:predicted ATPase
MPRSRSSTSPQQRKPQGPFIREIQLRREKVPDFDSYPFSIPAIRSLEAVALHPAVTFFIGENGSGKSTLIEAVAIAAGLNPEGGSKNLRFSFRATESSLHEAIRLVRGTRREKRNFFLRAESMFNLAIEVVARGLDAYGWEDLHVRSHGEALLWLVQNRFGSEGLFVLDEPESALSPQRQLAFLVLLDTLVKQGSQLLIATHSPILMAYPNAIIYELDSEGMRTTEYMATEHYTVMKTFLDNPERTLRQLFDPR